MMTPFLRFFVAVESWSFFQYKFHFVDFVCGEHVSYCFSFFGEEIAFTI